jgi:hypothetical protein
MSKKVSERMRKKKMRERKRKKVSEIMRKN